MWFLLLAHLVRAGSVSDIDSEADATCVGAGVALQVERVVESLATEGAEVALDVAVALHVSV